jgi:asparagine synthase (glutamine-hydrolysing)
VLHEPLETFSGSLRYRDFDEAPYARMVAERYGTRHHERAIEPSLIRLLPRLVEQLDEPSDPLSACTFLIAALARERVKVVLGGDGGDELFGGYDRYYGHGYASRYAWIPAPLRRAVLGPALHALPAGGWYKSRGNQLRWLHELSFAEGGARYARSLGYFYFGDCERRHGLYTGEMARAVDEFDPGASIAEAYEGAQARDPVDRMICADSRLRLPDHSVMILDRMTMAHGLEARSPFLDHELFEFSARLPGRLKVRGRELRRAEVRLAERYLPPALLERPKQGFSSALPYMLRAEYERLFDVLLRDLHLARDGVLRPEPVRELLAEHRAGRADHANRLWLLVNAEAWYRVRIEGVAAEALEQELAA